MRKETRMVVYDEALHLEAYRLTGIVQPFPNHFHEYYVIGSMEGGERRLSCKNREYLLKKGDIVLFNPGDNHACSQSGDEPLDYWALNIPETVMLDLAEEITGKREACFSETVIRGNEIACYLRPVHQMVMSGSDEFGKEENLLLLLSALLRKYGQEGAVPECRGEIDLACAFMKEHLAERISLDQICRHAGLSKSTLLRAFTKSMGVTPYRYLEATRIGEAKKLLERGATPLEAAMSTGFSDQSHFTNYFSSFIGLAPGVYREIFLDRGGRAHDEE